MNTQLQRFIVIPASGFERDLFRALILQQAGSQFRAEIGDYHAGTLDYLIGVIRPSSDEGHGWREDGTLGLSLEVMDPSRLPTAMDRIDALVFGRIRCWVERSGDRARAFWGHAKSGKSGAFEDLPITLKLMEI